MEMIIAICLMGMTIACIILDRMGRINLMNKWVMALYMLIYPNIILMLAVMKITIGDALSSSSYAIFLLVIVMGNLYMYYKINFFPFEMKKEAGLRLNIMYGGRIIVYCGIYAFIMHIIILLTVYNNIRDYRISSSLSASIIYSAIVIFLLLCNGTLRIFFTSYKLGIKMRIIMLCVIWIPIVNLVVLCRVCRMVYDEFDFEYQSILMDNLRVSSDICRTRYPIVMVHGLGFRNLKLFNYWGRIPTKLMENGATVYYGNQEAFATVIDNATDIKDNIVEILNATGCKKVNIIAHSKGGLDARYAIKMFGLDEYVASLTTINTPHHGTRIINEACKTTEGLYRFVSKHFDRMFIVMGDKKPDFYSATRQLSTEAVEKFNSVITDSPKVYYQSYTSKVKNVFSARWLGISYLIIKKNEGDNDGFVSIESAKWGEFRGVFDNKSTTGISHSDIVDHNRKDYVGFDVAKEYVNIVGELKIKGF